MLRAISLLMTMCFFQIAGGLANAGGMFSTQAPNQKIRILNDMVALKTGLLNEEEIIKIEVGVWSIVPLDQAQPIMQQMTAQESVKLLVTQNVDTGELGVSDGTILVFPRNMADVGAVAFEYGLEIVDEFNHLDMVLVRPERVEETANVIESLMWDRRVAAAELNTNFGNQQEL